MSSSSRMREASMFRKSPVRGGSRRQEFKLLLGDEDDQSDQGRDGLVVVVVVEFDAI